MSFLLNLPTSNCLSIFWNLGSMLGFVLVFQILSGTFLTFFYVPYFLFSYDSVQFIMYEVLNGWFVRNLHMNGASLFFVFLYFHMLKGLIFGGYRLNYVWKSGMLIFLLVMGSAFSGYSIVYSQMSYWGLVVITNLMTVIPYLGSDLVFWIWGGYYVSNNTLKFFFTLHFLMPYVVFFMVFIHLYFLHFYGSSDFVGYQGDYGKVTFNPFYLIKDLYNIFFFLIFFMWMFYNPFFLSDSGLFMESNSMLSPIHIVPEWYFLPFYGALRSVPNKLLGVFFMFFMIVELYFLSFSIKGFYKSIMDFMTFVNILYLIFVFFILGWLGQCLAEEPFIILGFNFLTVYFFMLSIFMFSI